MYECVQVGENTFFMDCPSRVGIYRDGGAAWLIDSGSDKDAAKKVLKILDDLGLRLEAAIVTHYHADHTGGAALLQQRTNCRPYLTEFFKDTATTEIYTALLFGRAPATSRSRPRRCPKACALSAWTATPSPSSASVRRTISGSSATP